MKKQLLLLAITLITGNFYINAKKPATSEAATTAKQYTTSQTGNLRLSYVGEFHLESHEQPIEIETNIFINQHKKFQTVLGIGGALTDASAETFYKMPASKQKDFLKSYYNPITGIGYSLARTSINSCDFSSDTYTYVENNDSTLKTFNLSHDLKYRIPFIKEAISEAGGKLVLYVSPWSPPAWMKDNNNMLQGGKLLPQYQQAWANYYVKFIREYEKLGIPIWGLSVQNEPMAKQTWESCIFTATEEKNFVKNYLGPTLYKSGMEDKKVIVWDHNRDLMFQRANEILSDKDAAKYIWGTGFHWYEDWKSGFQQFENVQKVNEAFPDKNLMFTEGCIGKFKYNKINDWKHGEHYGESMIHDFNNGTVGWTDWNILLDEKGGPNHVNNFCFAPVHYNTKTGELIYNSEFYYIGHFSKFVKPGAKRISASSSRSYLLTTAFQNTDGKIAVIVMNEHEKKEAFSVWIDGKSIETNLPGRSISTFVID
ncbi:MAG: glycoside hydrolase family 30 protein [Paludibacter sp.]|nr:glycoside hydrolase family 30 protein [Paludibacter sp.]